MDQFLDKTVMVTGAGRGIGAAIAARFAREGARTAICDLDLDSATDTAETLNNEGCTCAAIAIDVCSSESVDRAVSEILERWGRVDILVNNAGITIAKPVLEFAQAEWDRMIDVNLKGVLRCAQRVGKEMTRQGDGVIINIASESGKTAKPLFTVYATTKFAVVGFTQGLAQELAPAGVRVNAVCPGIVNTKMWEELDKTLSKQQGLKPGEALEKRRRAIPLGRLEEPEDVAKVVTFLASADAAYMTGQSVNVTGGREFH